MHETDIIKTLMQKDTLLSNEYYFKYIFKKIEKIVASVFYISAHITDPQGHNSELVSTIEHEALTLLHFAGSTLSHSSASASSIIPELSQRLVVLESGLRVLNATGKLEHDHLNVFVAEIDTALRSMRSLHSKEALKEPSGPRSPSRSNTHPPTFRQSRATPQPDRKSRIIAVLQAQPHASIKDISDTIKDFSEKTIQRDLNDMIAEGRVVREGEKRWSKYSLVS